MSSISERVSWQRRAQRGRSRGGQSERTTCGFQSLLVGIDDPSRLAVVDELGEAAFARGQDRRAAGKHFEHHDGAGLVPVDRVKRMYARRSAERSRLMTKTGSEAMLSGMTTLTQSYG